MPSRDGMNCLHTVPLFTPKAAVTDDTAQVSAIIDTKGYDACTLALVTGTLTDANATFTVLVEDGDASNLSDAAAVADKFLVGTEVLASFTFAADGKCRKIGYVGDKRYVRVTVTPSGNTGDLYLAGMAILGNPHVVPTPNPPQA